MKIEKSTSCDVEGGVGLDPKRMGKEIFKIALGAVIAGQSMVFGLGINMSPIEFGTDMYWLIHGALLASALVVMALLGGPLFVSIAKCIRTGRFSTEGLFFISMLGALSGSIISSLQGKDQIYYEVVAIVLVIYSIGRLVSTHSRSKAQNECARLRQEYDFAFIEKDSERTRVNISQLDCCSVVEVAAGELITVDGIIIEGSAQVVETAINGEMEPSARAQGDSIYAGSHLLQGSIKIRPTALKGERKIDGLLNTVEQAQGTGSSMQDQADAIMGWFLPVVMTVCFGTFVYWFGKVSWADALFNSMAVLLVACPCALGLATPVAVWTGLWNLGGLGIISRSGQFLDVLARANRFIFDKTGTLSIGTLAVESIEVPDNKTEDEVLAIIQAIERQMDHPIARALSTYREVQGLEVEVKKVESIPGKGVRAQVIVKSQVHEVVIGDLSLMEGHAFWDNKNEAVKRTVYCEIDNEPAAKVYIDEQYRPWVDDLFDGLNELGARVTILTGDVDVRRSFSDQVEILSQLDPEQKEAFVRECIERGETLLYVGDGINDAAAMAVSSGSLAIQEGSSLTKSTCGAVVVGEKLESLLPGIKLARSVRKNVYGSMKFAVCYNVVGITLAAVGKLHPVVAALLMLISSLLVSLRALRLSRSS